ncbi:hypothetical protein PR202_gb11516 [Eleusine coracana subsp. coracana]|uniref:GIR1-like zinc ribbon domain-containing protein n=1 Tax=Eleusine coracana subsp. coracana TaxID=191504 RepID=A0AAV5ENG3_ELECO|nr:hypothetical protein QOZ80_3BG0267840 [Eleusine coracana subsp. coracana]GJN23830.1 hypothetical protein PR202_gb11516 [Eleusine coracana subsp. coracana]
MAAEAVGFMSRGANGGRPAELVTRDFLGGCAAADDARDAAARQHDAVPGKLSLPKHTFPPTPRDLNLFPVATPCPASSPAPAPTGTAAASSAGATATTTYHSVCTIEKVKTALERFERGKHHHHHHQNSGNHHQQQHSGAGASPSSSSVTTSSVKRRGGVDGGSVEQGDGCDSPSAGGGGGMVAAACPRCFLYVLISRSDPRCPRCEAHVPAPPPPAAVSKKPRIDLNVGYLGT